MPKKVIGREMTQEDVEDAMRRLKSDHGVLDISLNLAYSHNRWIAVQAECWDYEHMPPIPYRTQTTYITLKGPHMVTTIWRHFNALWHIVDNARSGGPRPAGY